MARETDDRGAHGPEPSEPAPYLNGRSGQQPAPGKAPESGGDTGSGFVALLNPALLLAAALEAFAGALVAGAPLEPRTFAFPVAGACLFGAGSLFGHFFDRDLDARHDPSRAIPSGRTPARQAWRVAWALLVGGVLFGAAGGVQSATFAVALALVVVLHSAVTKSIWGVSFLTIGVARGTNFLFGLTAAEHGVERFHMLAAAFGVMALGWGLLRAARQPGAPAVTGLVSLGHFVAGVSLLLYQFLRPYTLWLEAAIFLALGLTLTLPQVVEVVGDARRPVAAGALQWAFLGIVVLEVACVAAFRGAFVALPAAALALALLPTLRHWPLTLMVRPR